MPDDTSPILFWTALALTLAGMVLTLLATAVIARRALRDRGAWESKVEAGKAILKEKENAHAMLKLQRQDAAEARQRGQRPSQRFLPDDEYNEGSIDRKYDAKFEAAVGRRPSSFTYADQMVLPELMALAITRDQIAELKLPAALVAAGVVVSTIGSILSLWA